MPTLKDKARAEGRKIRRETGIPLPLAMLAGKRLVRGRSYELIHDARFDGMIKEIHTCSCCGPEGHSLFGPKGEVRL